MRKSLAILAGLWLAVPAQAQDAILIGAGSPSKVATGGGGYTGPGDVVSGAVAWWGLRAYSTAYAAAHGNVVKLCDSTCSGPSQTVFTANTNGTITVGGTACGGSACTLIMTLYDQSGANSCGGSPCDLTQSTTANMPTYNPTAFSGTNTRPGIARTTGTGTINLPASTSTLTLAQPFVFSVVGEAVGSVSSFDNFVSVQTGTCSSSANVLQIGPASTAGSWFMYTGGSIPTATASTGAVHSGIFTFADGTTASEIDIDGSAGAGPGAILGNTTGLSSNTVCLPGIQNASQSILVFEAGIWSGTLTGTQKTNLSNNQVGSSGYYH